MVVKGRLFVSGLIVLAMLAMVAWWVGLHAFARAMVGLTLTNAAGLMLRRWIDGRPMGGWL